MPRPPTGPTQVRGGGQRATADRTDGHRRSPRHAEPCRRATMQCARRAPCSGSNACETMLVTASSRQSCNACDVRGEQAEASGHVVDPCHHPRDLRCGRCAASGCVAGSPQRSGRSGAQRTRLPARPRCHDRSASDRSCPSHPARAPPRSTGFSRTKQPPRRCTALAPSSSVLMPIEARKLTPARSTTTPRCDPGDRAELQIDDAGAGDVQPSIQNDLDHARSHRLHCHLHRRNPHCVARSCASRLHAGFVRALQS